MATAAAEGKKKVELYGRLGGKSQWKAKDVEAARAVFAEKAPKEIPELVSVHKAWMVMLVRQGVVERERGRRILEVLAGVDEGAVAEMVADFDPDTPKPVYQLERYLVNKVGDSGSDVNIGRTIPPPFYRLAVRGALLELLPALSDLQETVIDKAAEHVETVMPGYTHGQHAQPTTLGHYLMSFNDALERAYVQAEAAYANVNLCDLGCGALAGTSFDVDRESPAHWLGFDGVLENANDCVASTDQALDVVCALTNIAIPLSRVANEMYVWSSFEHNMVEIADELAAPSSMMPQKKNPAMLEFMRMKLAEVAACYADITTRAHGIPYGDVCDIKSISMRVCPTVRGVAGALKSFGRFLNTLIVKREIMLQRAAAGFSTASELAAVLYREAGIPLRLAHGVVAAVVRRVWSDGGLATEITSEIVDEATVEVVGRPAKLSPGALRRGLDPVEFVKAHTCQGGVAPVEVRRMIADRREKLAAGRGRQRARLERIENAAVELDAAVAEIVGQPGNG
jgi:argininosuccinate lyase